MKKSVIIVLLFFIVGIGFTHDNRNIIDYDIVYMCFNRDGKLLYMVEDFKDLVKKSYLPKGWQPIGGIDIIIDTSSASKFYTMGYCMGQSFVKYEE